MIAQTPAAPLTESIAQLPDGSFVLRAADGFEAAVRIEAGRASDAAALRGRIAEAHAEIVRLRAAGA